MNDCFGPLRRGIFVPISINSITQKEALVADRFDNLEIKVAFLEKSLEELDEVVRGLSEELVDSRKEIKWLREKVLSNEAEAEPTFSRNLV